MPIVPVAEFCAQLRRLPPFATTLAPPLLPFAGSAAVENATAVRWAEPDISRWLEAVIPGARDTAAPTSVVATLRATWSPADPSIPQEVRLDWQPAAVQARTLALPGFTVELPPATMLSLLLLSPGVDNRVVLVVTLPANGRVRVASQLAWERDGVRELLNDELSGHNPAVRQVLWCDLAPAIPASLVLQNGTARPDQLPRFLEQLVAPLLPLDLDDAAALAEPTPIASMPLEPGSWQAALTVDANNFVLPFLRRTTPGATPLQQRLQFAGNPPPNLPIDLASGRVSFDVPLRLTLANQVFPLVCPLVFDLATVALSVDHQAGLNFLSTPAVLNGSLLGLQWRFSGRRTDDGRFHVFTLATRHYNYQLQLAPGASLALDYRGVSAEPLTFAGFDFAVTPAGINLAADVTDKPVKLNGIDTRFRFTQGRLVIREDRITDFTITGAGPLPPALVGDSTVDLALQFRQVGGGVDLVAGTAMLRGRQELDCRPTRFRFAIDGLGLRFVRENGFQLYFALNGTARFVLDPGDDRDGPLALLSQAKIQMLDCPLAGDGRILGKHINFLVTLPEARTFSFLGCFEMEVRGFGFVPQAAEFAGDAAMRLSGQLRFAQGAGDVIDARVDVHNLFIGLPGPGEWVPRIHFKRLAVNLGLGEAFRLAGVVEFVDEPTLKGFRGEGMLQVQGLPTIAAAFGFLRVRRDANSRWLRAWFIYAELRQISIMIPIVQIYIREVGLGFGYRYTLTSIKAADETNSPRELIKALDKLSRTQGELAKIEQWAVDPENPGQLPRWTLVLRAMISQMSAAPTPLTYEPVSEQALSNLFLFDAVIALRSDLTFFMAVRGWINTNYADYVTNFEGTRSQPLFTGYVLLSPRQKRFLARLANNPGAVPGRRPPLPAFMRDAIANSRFSATLLVEPGLYHYELGWPNMLGWTLDMSVLKLEVKGGFIFRVSTSGLITGTSLWARGTLHVDVSFDFGFIGARIFCHASVAYGARQIGVLDFKDPIGKSALYAAVGLEVQIQFGLEVWIEIDLEIETIRKSFSFSLNINFTASLEMAHTFDNPTSYVGIPALRGTGTVGVSVCGHNLHLGIKLGFMEQNVEKALAVTKETLKLGLEASNVEDLPGMEGGPGIAMAGAGNGAAAPISRAQHLPNAVVPELGPPPLAPVAFQVPGYSIFVYRQPDADGHVYFVLYPSGERPVLDANNNPITIPETGFLPPPPAPGLVVESDFILTLPPLDPAVTLEHFVPGDPGSWQVVAGDVAWTINWDQAVVTAERSLDPVTGQVRAGQPHSLTLARYLRGAFKNAGGMVVGDPDPMPAGMAALTDPRVHHPSDDSFDAAVRGAFEQFAGSPWFKFDPDQLYDRLLRDAFDDLTTLYAPSGRLAANQRGRTPADLHADPDFRAAQQNQQAYQVRGMIIHDLIADVRTYAAASPPAREELATRSIPFQMGLVFRCRTEALPAWLNQIGDPGGQPQLRQRNDPAAAAPAADPQPARTFNVLATDFAATPPRFERVRWYSDAGTIALTWDLTWDTDGRLAAGTPAQRDPDHHLAYYTVQRRPLDSGERAVAYTVAPATALHRAATANEAGEETDVLLALKPRFQIVDHFSDQTTDDLAALPQEGRSYLYAITPVDFAGRAGRPLTVIAARRPTTPPPVPVDAAITVQYQVDADLAVLPATPAAVIPNIMTPRAVRVAWTEPAAEFRAGVPIQSYVFVFRRDRTLPIGSYGLDSSTQAPRGQLLSTANARPLPTDILITLPVDQVDAQVNTRRAEIPLAALVGQGVLPSHTWQPDGWQVFVQTVGANGVPSALAPVVVQLTIGSEVPNTPPEEYRPSTLEWLPPPLRLPLLPPADEAAQVGDAHVPMPLQPMFAPTGAGVIVGDISGFRRHPAQLRAIRVRWNQGESANPTYPLELIAGYRLHALDIDAHTTATLSDGDRLARALQVVQDVQMLPSDQVLLAPADTLSTSQWEAWYASDLRRPRRSDPDNWRGPWYSWRESYLIWPRWPGLTDTPLGQRRQALHPFLARILAWLTQPDPRQPARLTVAPQINPPAQPSDLASLLRATSPKTDPYGWNILQRLGLAATFTLHDAHGFVTGDDLVQRVHAAVTAALTMDDNANDFVGLRPHLHIELLFQPGQSVRLQEDAPDGRDLLALVQISLRPQVSQDLRYFLVDVQLNDPLSSLEVDLVATSGWSAIDLAEPEATPSEAGPDQPGNVVLRIDPDMHGQFVVRAVHVAIPLKNPAVPQMAAEFNQRAAGAIRYVALPTPRLVIEDWDRITNEMRDSLFLVVGNDDQAKRLLFFFIRDIRPLRATDDETTAFTAPVTTLVQRFARSPQDDVMAAEWRHLRAYLEALSSNDPTLPATSKIQVPTDAASLANLVPDILAWTQRFFDASGLPQEELAPEMLPGGGPWLATAYPRAGTPAYAAPDASGRLGYFHLLEDRWAHNQRYYIEPYSRYDLLWHSIRTSAQLFPTAGFSETPPPVVDPKAGGLDVVVDRAQPVAMPLVLSSVRLDEPASPARPPVPGRTWEVIVAQHPEQMLSQRNQTLARRLSFRQVAFTLLRRFQPRYDLWRRTITAQDIPLRFVEDIYPGIPTAYPETPDHLDVSAPLDSADARSLDLPERLGAFQQGALVLQWEGLPFYYEHQLLLMAQTDRVVSPVNRITQADFEYRSPLAAARLFAVDTDIRHARILRIPLRRLWDSLPDHAQQRWPFEAPDPVDSPEPSRKPGAIPDLDVVYQLVDFSGGNVEVQSEIFLDPVRRANPAVPPAQRFSVRRLGDRYLANDYFLESPTTPQGDFHLLVWAVEVTRLRLATLAAVGNAVLFPPGPRPFGLEAANGTLTFVGALDFALLDYLLRFVQAQHAVDADKEQDTILLRSVFTWWTRRELVSNAPAQMPNVADARFEPATEWVLTWHGEMTADDIAALTALDGDAPFKQAIQNILAAASDIRLTLLPPLDQPPPVLAPHLTATLDAVAGGFTALTWNGPLHDEDISALRLLATDNPSVVEAVEGLIAERDAFRIVVRDLVDLTPVIGAADQQTLARMWEANTVDDGAQRTWVGRVKTREDRAFLHSVTARVLPFPLSPRAIFSRQIGQILQQTAGTTTVPLSAVVPLRPRQADLGTLGEKLHLAETWLAYQGHMTAEDAQLLMAALPAAGDRRAIARLYEASLFSGQPGHTLLIRTRRGSAPPSDLVPPTAESLTENQ